ncbi:leucyl aminopeptidase [uncultured Brevundimonas sp.]|uniref:leucyl aminopeptidase n=1 Tax=uncultured Brevundimonas sp. TaxID=213418 RepID=UPI002607B0CE|nr:leucyl aminopeptidase [uncultured Brevundimonas sp.]
MPICRNSALALAALMVASGLSVAAPADAQTRRATTAVSAPAGAQPRYTTPREVAFSTAMPAPSDVLVIFAGSEDDLANLGLDEATLSAVRQGLTAARFSYGNRKSVTLYGTAGWSRIHVQGLKTDATLSDYQTAGTIAGRALISETSAITVAAKGLAAEQVAEITTGMGIGQYRVDFYNTEARAAVMPGDITVVTDNANAEALYRGRGAHVVDAVFWTRNISNEPANIVYPEVFAQRTREAFAGVPGVTVEVLDVAAMERLGMGALLGVGRGSPRPPALVAVRYRGQGASGAPVALVGKGITFDSGGISIKPSANMGNMKMDMSGAAGVVGAVMALAKAGAPVDVVAVAAVAENMPDGNAIRPGDVLTAMNGRTIEIISTDAEGRLVLADALHWAEVTYNPAAIIDVATLTGAVGGALGPDYAGLFTRHDALAEQLRAAGEASGENVWQLPLHPSYESRIASPIADMRNSGEPGPGAGMGAVFVANFVSPETPWAHLDIANMAYGAANDVRPAGSAGWSVRLLEQFVRDFQPIAREKGKGGY